MLNQCAMNLSMGILNSLFGPGTIPSIDDANGVIEWFLKYDDVRNFKRLFPAKVDSLKEDILLDMSKHNDATSLEKFINEAMEFWEHTVFPQAFLRKDGPVESESEQERIEIIAMESFLSAKLRILGYFLSKKYGIEM